MFRKLWLCVATALGCLAVATVREGHTADQCPDTKLKNMDCPPESGDTAAWSKCEDVLLEENCGKYGLVSNPSPNSFLYNENVKGWRVTPRYVEQTIDGVTVWVPKTEPCYTRRQCIWHPELKCTTDSLRNTWQFSCYDDLCPTGTP